MAISIDYALRRAPTFSLGDISPVTPQGKFIGMVCASLGVIFIAIPAGIVISG